MRTPRTPAVLDTIALEVANLRALTETQTPLMGGENTPLVRAPVQSSSETPSATPMMGGTPFDRGIYFYW